MKLEVVVLEMGFDKGCDCQGLLLVRDHPQNFLTYCHVLVLGPVSRPGFQEYPIVAVVVLWSKDSPLFRPFLSSGCWVFTWLCVGLWACLWQS
jgi:hypothetical protein